MGIDLFSELEDKPLKKKRNNEIVAGEKVKDLNQSNKTKIVED
jgi:hypothetical protein